MIILAAMDHSCRDRAASVFSVLEFCCESYHCNAMRGWKTTYGRKEPKKIKNEADFGIGYFFNGWTTAYAFGGRALLVSRVELLVHQNFEIKGGGKKTISALLRYPPDICLLYRPMRRCWGAENTSARAESFVLCKKGRNNGGIAIKWCWW